MLVAALVAFGLYCVSFAVTEPDARGVGVLLALAALLFAAGLLFPGRNRLLLRTLAGAASLAYVAYFVQQLVALIAGQPQEFAVGQPSALMANLALLIIAMPLARYAVTGRTSRERVAELAARNDPTGALTDRASLGALAAAGVDLAQEAELLFRFEFPSAAHAASAELVVRREGHDATTTGPADGAGPFRMEVRRRLVPSWDAVRAARARYEGLARELGGRFTGWVVSGGE